jgi:uncharacterized membrane protein (DUF485 family)
MLHEPVSDTKQDYAAPYKAKLGLWMFVLYAVIYFGFIALNLIDPSLMERTVLGGSNLAIIYGIGLIIFAWLLAVVYNALSTKKENELNVNEAENLGD